MSNSDFIEKELNEWGKVYTDITYAINEISEFLDDKELKRRKYYVKLSVLKEYIDDLNRGDISSSSKKGFLSSMFNSSSSNDLTSKFKTFKRKNKDTFDQLSHCAQCACLSCIEECSFKKCSGCRDDSHIKKCDRDKINVRVYDNFLHNITDNNTGSDGTYRTLAVLNDCELDRLYIILENIHDEDDKFILYYYPKVSGNDYGEITDSEEFDYIIETFESSDY